jgi:hypothetical protein
MSRQKLHVSQTFPNPVLSSTSVSATPKVRVVAMMISVRVRKCEAERWDTLNRLDVHPQVSLKSVISFKFINGDEHTDMIIHEPAFIYKIRTKIRLKLRYKDTETCW